MNEDRRLRTDLVHSLYGEAERKAWQRRAGKFTGLNTSSWPSFGDLSSSETPEIQPYTYLYSQMQSARLLGNIRFNFQSFKRRSLHTECNKSKMYVLDLIPWTTVQTLFLAHGVHSSITT